MEQQNLALMEAIERKNAVLEGINRIFAEALSTPSIEELGQVCLAVAEDMTGAAFSFMGEVHPLSGRLEDLAISKRGWAAFTADDQHWPDGKLPMGLHVNGLHGRVILDECSQIINDPDHHPDRIGTPTGHPPLRNFLGVPLKQDGRTVGLVALANRGGGFRDVDREAVEELAPAILQALRSKRAEEALRESEEVQRLSMQLMPAMLWRASPGGIDVTANRRWAELTGQTDEESAAGGWITALHPDDQQTAQAIFDDAYARGVPLEVQLRVRLTDATYRWYLLRQVPVRNAAGQIRHWFGAGIDIHDLQSLEERQRVLVAELQHRVRNILTVVRSVFARTVDAGGTLEDVADHFRGRLDALARTQVIVTQTPSGAVDLENLIRDELLSVGASDGPSLMLSGPDVSLSSSAAESIGLAMHELAINAVKYGALKFPNATLDIRWQVDLDCRGARRLTLTWTEQGVPAVSISPTRQGFGSELIEEALPYRLGADTRLEFLGGGVRCSISLPLSD